jgi:hypothetical protein
LSVTQCSLNRVVGGLVERWACDRRAAHRLSAIKVSKVKTPGLYEDGAGLRLVVRRTYQRLEAEFEHHAAMGMARIMRGLAGAAQY